MKYPENLKIIIDVTKPPYCADNTGRVDCTEILKKVYNDIIETDVAMVRETYEMLKNAPDGQNTYVGFQSRKMANGTLNLPIEDTPEFICGDLSEWVCVDDFGACGDGTTDSTEAIQKAFNSGARIVYFNEVINFTAHLANINSVDMPVIVNDNSDVSVVSGNITDDYPVVVREITDDAKDILKETLRDDRCIDGYIGELTKLL